MQSVKKLNEFVEIRAEVQSRRVRVKSAEIRRNSASAHAARLRGLGRAPGAGLGIAAIPRRVHENLAELLLHRRGDLGSVRDAGGERERAWWEISWQRTRDLLMRHDNSGPHDETYGSRKTFVILSDAAPRACGHGRRATQARGTRESKSESRGTAPGSVLSLPVSSPSEVRTEGRT